MSRRGLLRNAALLMAAGVGPGAAFARATAAVSARGAIPLAGARLTQRVVLVIFGGGVRSSETLGSGNTPNLDRIAAAGVSLPRTAVQNIGHYGAASSIITGSWDVFGIRENGRSEKPTLFEIIRREAGLPASEVWLSTSGGDQETNYAYSTASGYGPAYGANLIGGEGIFNAEFKELVVGQGGLRSHDAAAEKTLSALRGAMETPLPIDDGGDGGGGGGGLGNDPVAAARIEQYILEELRGDAAEITGLGANDAKAMHVARNLLAIFRPKLLTVTLRAPDVAHGSFNDYVTTIKRNDQELGLLFDAITGDASLAESTALFVLPEFGRDRDFNARRGLDHGDQSQELLSVNTVAWGPDFKSGVVERSAVRSIDVAPTIVSLFGGRMGARSGSPIKELFA
ncbi:MAG: hypothetical protein ACI9EF_002827 [Pseudohongiellaceae bacterium]|jgi:hypothetical protein